MIPYLSPAVKEPFQDAVLAIKQIQSKHKLSKSTNAETAHDLDKTQRRRPGLKLRFFIQTKNSHRTVNYFWMCHMACVPGLQGYTNQPHPVRKSLVSEVMVHHKASLGCWVSSELLRLGVFCQTLTA